MKINVIVTRRIQGYDFGLPMFGADVNDDMSFIVGGSRDAVANRVIECYSGSKDLWVRYDE